MKGDVYAANHVHNNSLRPASIRQRSNKRTCQYFGKGHSSDTPPDIETYSTHGNMNHKNTIPNEMIDICKIIYDKDPFSKNNIAADLSKYLENWLDGIKQKEKAQTLYSKLITSAKKL